MTVMVFSLLSCSEKSKLPVESETRLSDTEYLTEYDELVKYSMLEFIYEFYPDIYEYVYSEFDNLVPEFYNTETLLELFPDVDKLKTNVEALGVVENLFAIYNFGDDNGYAIVSASQYIDDDLIFITNKGSIYLDDFTENYDAEYIEINGDNPIRYLTSLINLYALEKVGSEEWFLRQITGYRKCITYDNWETIESIGPLVELHLGQGEPYNAYCTGWLGGSDVLVGCVPVAVTHVVSAVGYPTSFGDVVCDWGAIISDLNAPDISTTDVDNLFRAMAVISSDCKTLRTQDFGLALPLGGFAALVEYFDGIEYQRDITYENIYNMISESKPVFCYGFDWNAFVGHAWVIDGILHQQTTKTCWKNSQSTYDVYVDRKFVHHNFGWEGIGDGYLVVGVYDLSYVDSTTGDYSSNDRNYNFDNKLIIYNK